MNDSHRVYLSLGSNIGPEVHLPKAVQLLRKYGRVESISTAWESESVGFDGPNFLNLCLLFITHLPPYELKEQIIRPIETELGRVRYAEKNAPRTIDLDIVLFDDRPLNVDFWNYAFVIVPLAELIPHYRHPGSGEKLSRVSAQLRDQVWIVPRRDVVIS